MNVLASEWLKLRTVRSTHYTLGVAALTVVLGCLWALYAGGLWDGSTPQRQAVFRAAAPEEGFLPLLQICLGVLGVLAVTSEYTTGMIRTSLAAVPARPRLLAAKTGVVASVALLSSAAILLTTYALSRLIAGDRTMGFNLTPFAEDLPLLLASAVSATALALVGLGLGTVLRSTAGGIVSVVALLFVLPGIAAYLPAPWNTRVASVLLPNLPAQIAGDNLSVRLGDGLLSPPLALASLVAYAAIALGAAVVALTRRDA